MSSSRRSSWPSRNSRAPSQLAQRDADGIADDVAGAGPQRREPGDQGGRGVPGEPGPQVIGPGQDQGPGLVDRPGAFSCGAAPGDHQRADRLHGAVPALRRAAGPAGLGGPGSADRVQRVGLALPAAVLPVGAVHLDDPDAGGCHVPGQAGAVAAGPLDPDQGDGPEPGQPAQQPGIAGRRGRELPTPSSPPMGSSAAATCTSAWVSTPPVMARVSTMVTVIPFTG